MTRFSVRMLLIVFVLALALPTTFAKAENIGNQYSSDSLFEINSIVEITDQERLQCFSDVAKECDVLLAQSGRCPCGTGMKCCRVGGDGFCCPDDATCNYDRISCD